MTNEANLDLGPQAGMTDPSFTSDQKVFPTPSCRKGLHLKADQCLILEGLTDQVQQTGNPFIGGKGLHPILQTRSLDRD